MKLTIGSIEILVSAIVALDKGPALAPFKLLGSVRFKLFRNLTTLAPILEDFTRAKRAIAQEIYEGRQVPNEIPANTLEANAWHEKVGPLLSELVEVKLETIKTDDLNLDQNSIPFSVLCGLSPILIDCTEPSTTDSQV